MVTRTGPRPATILNRVLRRYGFGCRVPKVIGIGLSRTGTTSLIQALRRLGYVAEHYPLDSRTEAEVLAGSTDLTVIRRVDAIADIITLPFYKKWDRLYPGSRFVLTTRDKASWLVSIQRHFETARGALSSLDDFLVRAVYGGWDPSVEELARIFEQHEADVLSYFAGREEDLLILNIVKGGNWEPLCRFLGRPVPQESFPHRAASRR